MSRIDRFYVSGPVGDWGGHIGIHAGTCFSDHSPVMVVVSEGERGGSASIRVPASVQTDGMLADQVGQLWAQCQWRIGERAQSCADGLLRISDLLRDEATSRLCLIRESERALRRGVSSIQRQLERRPDSEWLGTQLAQARQELRDIEDRRYEFLFHRRATQWSQVGDRVTGEFFRITGPRFAREGVRGLRRPDGSVEVEPEGLREFATGFYRSLLSVEEESGTLEASRQRVLMSSVRRTVTEEMCDNLLAPFSEEELLRALKALPPETFALVGMGFFRPFFCSTGIS